jgi:hypothetical protein
MKSSAFANINQDSLKSDKRSPPFGQKAIPGIPVPPNSSGNAPSIPDEMLCVMCMDRTKEIMI